MQNFNTAEEKAAEWNITPRHVQYLCRMGKVEGAAKRAGVWLIPDSAPIPTKNTKSGSSGFKFIGTKAKIFNSSIELFMLENYNDVSLRDIADKVGVRQSTIYNHFSSKKEILDTIYDYFCHYFLENRPSLSDIEHALKEKSVLEIIDLVRYEFHEECKQQLCSIHKIIFQRIGVDVRANEIAKSLITGEGIRYVEIVFNRGIEIGRFAPFDSHSFSVFINSVRLFTLFNWIADPSPAHMSRIIEDEHKLYKIAAVHITDLCPPASAGRQIT